MRVAYSLLLAAGLMAQPSPSDLNRIKIGQPAPDFTALTADGQQTKLSQYLGKNIVLVFYRGQW